MGTLGTALGFLVFLVFLFTTVQVLFNLYATSAVTAAAHDAAREVAGFRSPRERCAAVPAAEKRFFAHLGRYGQGGHAQLDWTCTHPDVIRLRVSARHPTVLPVRATRLLGLGVMDRIVEARIEDG